MPSSLTCSPSPPRCHRCSSRRPSAATCAGSWRASGRSSRRSSRPVERGIYRVLGIDPTSEQALDDVCGLAARSSPSSAIALLYLQQRVQGLLPLNPSGARPGRAGPVLQHGRQLRDQHELAELLRRVDDELPDPDGRARRAELHLGCRGPRRRDRARPWAGRRLASTIGNFWVDLTRCTPLHPAADRGRRRADPRVAGRRRRPSAPSVTATTLEGGQQTIALGPVASQEVIKELGNNGGGFFNANSAHPFENPNALTNWLEMFLILLIPFGLTDTFGRMAGDRRQGWALFAAMMLILVVGAVAVRAARSAATRCSRPASTAPSATWRARSSASAPRPAPCSRPSRPGTSTGAVNAMHDSFLPIGGLVPMFLIQLGEIVPGGIGRRPVRAS